MQSILYGGTSVAAWENYRRLQNNQVLQEEGIDEDT